MGLFKKMKKNKKGFTLVELIVVLVILAILAAIAVPTFNGYINKAKEKQSAAEARSILLAADTVVAELNETNAATAVNTYIGNNFDPVVNEIMSLADITKGTDKSKITALTADDKGSIATLKYTSSTGLTYEYNATNHNMEKK